MTFRHLVLALCFALSTFATTPAGAQESDAPVPTRRARPAASARPATATSSQTDALLHQLADAQRSLGDQMQQLRERIDALHGEIAQNQDEGSGLEQEVKAARDEIKGLYVESSSVRQQIDALKEDVAGVNSNVSSFRTFSGFFIGVMILLLLGVFALTIRR